MLSKRLLDEARAQWLRAQMAGGGEGTHPRRTCCSSDTVSAPVASASVVSAPLVSVRLIRCVASSVTPENTLLLAHGLV